MTNQCQRAGIILFVIVIISSAANSYARENLAGYCLDTYQKTGTCPKDVCSYLCPGGKFYNGCELLCQPKVCLQLSADDCPTDTCQIVVGCTGEKICYNKLKEATQKCGGLSFPGQDVPCCEGFVKRCGVEFFDGTCDMIGKHSRNSIPICLPCGNGICNQFENRCNCPEDCGKPNSSRK